MINQTALLSTLKPAVTALEASIAQRADEVPEVAEHLAHEHQKAVAAERTAMSLEEWRGGEITQAAVAWVLGCVFVRFLEDNRLIDQPLIAGPGARGAAALGHRSEYFQREPGHSDRDYLHASFREVAAHPAVAALYDERHNPLWRLGPTADGARALRETFTAINPDTGDLLHDFTDPDLDTRFLGDLYQDLSETARERYALLQTPYFVERFILDRTLTPAIAEFGLEAVRLIDPTCGSGHFLIGAFERLFALWQEREPGTPKPVLAQRCLDQIAGVDLNPYATAIARFRLKIHALRVADIPRLAEAPPFALQLATGDSLLHGPLPSDGATMLFDAGQLDKHIAHVYESEDAAELRRILGRGYHAVVGNPPYVRGEDEAARAAYRARYRSCHRHFVLTVPFMERFFELANVPSDDRPPARGFVGKITANSFMKRDFGKLLVEDYLPSQNLTLVVDCSGADIPGHSGIPTVILFGRPGRATTSALPVARSLAGEGTGDGQRFWTELADELAGKPNNSNLVAVEERPREELATWPWSLSGDTGALVARLEALAARRLSSVLRDVGRITHTGDDQSFVTRLRPDDSWVVPFIRGDDLRDWSASELVGVLFPYDLETARPLQPLPARLARELWPRRTVLSDRKDFGKSPVERGLHWFEHSMFFPERFLDRSAVAFAYMAHVNHFVPLSGGVVTKQTAPVLRFKPGTDLDAVLGVLNSSTSAAFIHARCQPKPGFAELWSARFEVSNADLKSVPLPETLNGKIATELRRVASEAGGLLDDVAERGALAETLQNGSVREVRLHERMISLQEELDWQVLAAYGLAPDELPVLGEQAPPIALGQRAFEIVLARGETKTTWFERHGSTPITDVPADWPDEYRAVVEQRIALIESDPDVGLIERPEHKRRWNRTLWDDRVRDALTTLVLDALEAPELWDELQLRSTAELSDHLRRTPLLVEALEVLAGDRDADLGATVRRLVLDAAVPHPAAQRLTETGLKTRAVWETVWNLQRAEDRGETVDRIPVPPKYAKTDFRTATSWTHRGKLDVPKERFVLLPHAERGADTSPVVGWAGWDELQLARALAGRITELRDQDAADAARITPLLAGVLELLPWIHQWHPNTDPLFSSPPGAFFESWLDAQLAELATTRETLRAWRPPAPTRGPRRSAA